LIEVHSAIKAHKFPLYLYNSISNAFSMYFSFNQNKNLFSLKSSFLT